MCMNTMNTQNIQYLIPIYVKEHLKEKAENEIILKLYVIYQLMNYK